MTNFQSKYKADSGDLVQTVIIVAGFAVAAIMAVAAISGAINAKGAAAANCISGSSSYNTSGSAKNCKDGDDKATTNAKNNTADAYNGAETAKGIGKIGAATS